MTPLSPWAASTALLLLAGCQAHLGVCPEKGGPPWIELTSPHFRVQSNLEPAAAEHAVRKLEELRAAMISVFDGDAALAGRVDAIGFDNAQEVSVFKHGFIGFLTLGSGPEALLVFADDGFQQASVGPGSIKAHELAHLVSRQLGARNPKWLDEGLATYLETLQPASGEGEYLVGRPQMNALGVVEATALLPLDTLWRWNDDASLTPEDLSLRYAWSWLWVHYLVSVHPARLARLRRDLSEGADFATAWKGAFGDVPIRDLEGDASGYMHRLFPTRTVNARPSAITLSTRALDDADFHALRARIWLRTSGAQSDPARTAAGRDELAQALARRPDLLEARLLQLDTAPAADRLPLARGLVKTHAESSRAWSALAWLLQESNGPREERDEAASRAAATAGDDPVALLGAAQALLLVGHAAEALPLAQRSQRQAPWSAAVADTLAFALGAVGRCEEAVASRQRAIALLPVEAREAQRASVEAHPAPCRAGPAQEPPAAGAPP